MENVIQLVGPERAVEFFGVRLVGINGENYRGKSWSCRSPTPPSRSWAYRRFAWRAVATTACSRCETGQSVEDQ